MNREPFRIAPNLPANHYQTYAIHVPKSPCEVAKCEAWKHGWDTIIDESMDLGRRQAALIRSDTERTFREMKTGDLTVFRFTPRQRCFRLHDSPTRPEVYTVRPGDWRGTFGDTRRHASAADWVDDFGSHQDRLAEAIKRG